MSVKRIIRAAIAVAAASAAGAAVGGGSAPAHEFEHTPQFGPLWQTTFTPIVSFMGDVNTTGKQARTRDAYRQWNDVPDVALTYSADPDTYLGYRFNPNAECGPQGHVTIHENPIDGARGTLGRASYCYYSGEDPNFVGRATGWIEMDEDENWYTGTGDASGGLLGFSSEIDWWSVATHEFGHVSALAHFNDSSTFCDDDGPISTMCPFLNAGTEYSRSLETPDKAWLQHFS